MASCAALIIQSLAANLGVVTGMLYQNVLILLQIFSQHMGIDTALFPQIDFYCRKASSGTL